jgi:hypothetical protein
VLLCLVRVSDKVYLANILGSCLISWTTSFLEAARSCTGTGSGREINHNNDRCESDNLDIGEREWQKKERI